MADTRQYCTFYLDGKFFGIEVTQVQEVTRYQQMTEVPLARKEVSGLINLRGQIVSAIDLRKRLQMPDRPKNFLPMNVVVKTTQGVMSLLVDEIADVMDLSQDQFEKTPETVKGIARELLDGAYKLDKKLLMVLNVEKTICLAGTIY